MFPADVEMKHRLDESGNIPCKVEWFTKGENTVIGEIFWDQSQFGAQKMYSKNSVTLVKPSLHFPVQF